MVDPVAKEIENKVQAALDTPVLSTRAKAELIEGMEERCGWPLLLAAFERILLERRRSKDAGVLANVLFSASLAGREFDCNRYMALLLNCGIRSGTRAHTEAYNLILSTCVEMKGVDYQSGYSPEDDPEIRAEMYRLLASG